MTIRPPGKSLQFCFLKTEENVIYIKSPAQSDSTGGHIPNLLLLFKITQSTLYVKHLPIIFISPYNTHLTSSSVVFLFYRWHQEVKWFTCSHTYSKFLKVTSKETWERLLHSWDPNSSPAQKASWTAWAQALFLDLVFPCRLCPGMKSKTCFLLLLWKRELSVTLSLLKIWARGKLNPILCNPVSILTPNRWLQIRETRTEDWTRDMTDVTLPRALPQNSQVPLHDALLLNLGSHDQL